MVLRRIARFMFALLVCLSVTSSSAADQHSPSDPAAFVRALLDAPAGSMGFARAKLAVDTFVDPSLDADAALAEIDRMVATVNHMLSTFPKEVAATSLERMKALRAFLYESGGWNGNKPFQYDLSDPYGRNFATRLLSNYLAARKGNCVSMPILFLILGERLGLDVTLSTAPLHVFVKYTDEASGRTFNLETTSGAGFTRDSHYRRLMPMTDEAIANGVYLKTLTRREALSVIATLVLEHLLATRRYEEAIAVADVLLEAYPAHAYALVKKGTAYHRLLEEHFIRKYPKESDIPADRLPYAQALFRANQEAFDRAEALGWREPKLD